LAFHTTVSGACFDGLIDLSAVLAFARHDRRISYGVCGTVIAFSATVHGVASLALKFFTAELAFHGEQCGVTRVSLVTACNATVSSVAPLCTEAFPAFFARACVARVHFTGFPVYPVAFARFLRVSIVDRFALLAYLVFIVCPVSALVFTSAFQRLLACATLVIYIQFPAAHIAGKILDSHNLPSISLQASMFGSSRYYPIRPIC
jgi:hypothetical protein